MSVKHCQAFEISVTASYGTQPLRDTNNPKLNQKQEASKVQKKSY